MQGEYSNLKSPYLNGVYIFLERDRNKHMWNTYILNDDDEEREVSPVSVGKIFLFSAEYLGKHLLKK
jgi:hypothetical protein